MIEHLGSVGLALDMVGVVILGFDVVSFQKNARLSAQEAQSLLSHYSDQMNADVGWSEWRTGGVSEGLFEPDGGIDADAAQNEFRNLSNYTFELESRVTEIVAYLTESVAQQEVASSRSLSLTKFGLALIVVGFGLQIAAQYL